MLPTATDQGACASGALGDVLTGRPIGGKPGKPPNLHRRLVRGDCEAASEVIKQLKTLARLGDVAAIAYLLDLAHEQAQRSGSRQTLIIGLGNRLNKKIHPGPTKPACVRAPQLSRALSKAPFLATISRHPIRHPEPVQQ